MELKVVEFETAKLLKEVGFDEPSFECYNDRGMKYSDGWLEYLDDHNLKPPFLTDMLSENDMLAPTQALVQQWLRETHKLEIQIEPMWDDETKVKTVYSPWVLYSKEDESEDEDPEFFDTYEEALESAILEAIQLVLVAMAEKRK